MWIDSHAHLYNFTSDELEEILRDNKSAGVSATINTAVSVESSTKVISQNAMHPDLFAAVGISPFDIKCTEQYSGSWIECIERYSLEPRVVAIGEIGLDNSNLRYPPLASQIPVFEALLDLSNRRCIPAVIHSRGAERLVLDLCRSAGIKTVVFHCYTGSVETLGGILDEGYYVSFSGIITFTNNSLSDLVEYAPLDRILIETDTPYLAPTPHRGKPNRPAWASLVGEKIASIKNFSACDTAFQIAANVRNVFGIDIISSNNR